MPITIHMPILYYSFLSLRIFSFSFSTYLLLTHFSRPQSNSRNLPIREYSSWIKFFLYWVLLSTIYYSIMFYCVMQLLIYTFLDLLLKCKPQQKWCQTPKYSLVFFFKFLSRSWIETEKIYELASNPSFHL